MESHRDNAYRRSRSRSTICFPSCKLTLVYSSLRIAARLRNGGILSLLIWSCPFQNFVKQKDGPITRFAIRDSSLANHFVNCSCFNSQQLREFFYVQKLRLCFGSASPICIHCLNLEIPL